MPLALPAAHAAAATVHDAITDCAAIEDDQQRLACYDAAAVEQEKSRGETFLERLWDLSDRAKPFQPWAHRPNYILPARWSDSPNDEPVRELAAAAPEPGLGLQSVEVKFQISFKTKLLDDIFRGPGDLWFGYTQQSHFQIYNARASRPFRETDYEPELILTFPARQRWGLWTWRVFGAGIVHQSNGRSEPLSRSWNRVYALVAIERGNVSIQFRPWWRFDGNADSPGEDNPQITDYIGRFESTLVWTPRRHALVLRGRTNADVREPRGSLEADWFWPLGQKVRGQLQLFTGYGESLIDYNHRQTAIGVGILLFDPF